MSSPGLFSFGNKTKPTDVATKGVTSNVQPLVAPSSPASTSFSVTASTGDEVQVHPTLQLCKEDAVAAWNTHPRMPSRLMDTHVNLMVLGESGLGKTTFIENVTSSYKVVSGRVADGSSTSLSLFKSDPSSLRTVLAPMTVPESSRRLLISIQDAPGWGDDINLMRYMRVITSFLLEQRAKDFEKLAGSRTLDETVMCGVLEHSITACLYFLPPHRMKKVDLILMAAISRMVTLIPVIAKADCMTTDELDAYRSNLLGMLAAPNKYVPARGLPPLKVSMFSFADSILADMGLSKKQLPLAVVTSRESEPVADPGFLKNLGLQGVDAPAQPVRQYRWGNVYPLSRGHSDLIVLKRLLLGDRVESLYALLDDSYKRYVRFCKSFEAADKQVATVVQATCQAVSPHLEYDDYARAKAALASAKDAMTALSKENKKLAERLVVAEQERLAAAQRIRV